MDGGAWWATVLGIAKNWTRLSTHTIFHCVDIPHFTFQLMASVLFLFLAIMNHAAMNNCIQDFVFAYVFISFEVMSRY